jgi:hypothetical protein
MTANTTIDFEKVAIVLVILMTALQGFYSIFGYLDPFAFSVIRGTELVSSTDKDWVQIYASRTLFITLIIGYLIYIKHYRILMYTALFGMVMPITDAVLAYNAQAPTKVIVKHIVTIVYLAATFFALRKVVKSRELS